MKKNTYAPPKDRFGVRSFIARTLALTPGKMFLGMFAFKTLVATAFLGKIPVISGLYKRFILMSEKDFSQGYSIPLNVDLTGIDEQVVLPITIMKQAIKDASYRAVMNECVCRKAQNCNDYPRDLGCIFLGEAALRCVENKIAREATVQECNDHVDLAAKVGLSGQALWVEVEKYLWGFENNKVENFLEICFCCPCCCTGFKFANQADRHSRLLFHRSSGWKAKINTQNCVQCNVCYDVCPRHAIDLIGTSIQTNEDCGGCGLCIPKCPTQAIKLEQISVAKNQLNDYFNDINLKL